MAGVGARVGRVRTFEIRLNRMGGPEPEVLVVRHYFWNSRGPLDGVRVTVERERERGTVGGGGRRQGERRNGDCVLMSTLCHCTSRVVHLSSSPVCASGDRISYFTGLSGG